MGCGGSKEESEPHNETKKGEGETAPQKKPKKEKKKKYDTDNTILLQGMAASGKSTLAKQMRIIHLEGYPEEERVLQLPVVLNNVVFGMKIMLMIVNELGLELAEESQEAAERINGLSNEEITDVEVVDDEMRNDLRKLWDDPVIKEAHEKRDEVPVPEHFSMHADINSCINYYKKLDEVLAPDFVPEINDVLYARRRTTGVQKVEFVVDKSHYTMIDIGGGRAERRKWKQFANQVTAVIYFVDLNSYDKPDLDNPDVNALHNARTVFGEVLDDQRDEEDEATKTSVVLFLNKRDLFEEKIQRVDLNVCFDNYSGGTNFKKAIDYVKRKFASADPNRQIFTHVTVATDTENIRAVDSAVRDVLLQQALESIGIF